MNTIENYPYPYVIGKLCWEFPCMTPSDWQANHLHKPCNPQTVADWKAALDCTVIKQGVFAFVFHPHGWIKNDQMVEFIDYAVAKHGKKVKFLTFKEAAARMNRSLFDGRDFGKLNRSSTGRADVPLDDETGYASIAIYDVKGSRVHFKGRTWIAKNGIGHWQVKESDYATLDTEGAEKDGHIKGAVLPLPNSKVLSVLRFEATKIFYGNRFGRPQEMDFTLPRSAHLCDGRGKDAGLRFIDLDGDGKLDVVFSNEKEYGIYLFKDLKDGWSRKVMAGKAGDADALPMISRNGTNNGFWVHSGSLWWSNEDTVLLKDHVDRRSIKDLLKRAAR